MNRARNKKFVRDMMFYARGLGVESVSVEYGSKQPFIVGQYKGRDFCEVIPSSPYNEGRAMRRAQCNFRRAIKKIDDSLVAQRIEQRGSTTPVAGSIPAEATIPSV